jgi:hypothetical protein
MSRAMPPRYDPDLTKYFPEEDESFGRLAPRGWGYVRRHARQTSRSPRTILDGLRGDLPRDSNLLKPFAAEILEFYFGAAFGVWRRVAAPSAGGLDGMFAEIPFHPPALGLTPAAILVDDPGHSADLTPRIVAIAECDWHGDANGSLERLVSFAGFGGTTRSYFAREFFGDHLRRFSRSRRKAPIFWQLTTSSASYSVWLYAHALTKDTLYQVQSEYVAPKLAHEERLLTSLMNDAASTATAIERKQIASQEAFVEELRALLHEVKRVAPLWNPTLDDGVILTMAPLWRLIPQHKAWQKELKGKWDDLIAGKYDWAHITMHLWPERVVPKCATDRSLAIAHGLETIFWVEGDHGKWKQRQVPTRLVDEIVRERTSIAVKAALKSLLDVHVASANHGRKRGRRAAKAASDVEQADAPTP